MTATEREKFIAENILVTMQEKTEYSMSEFDGLISIEEAIETYDSNIIEIKCNKCNKIIGSDVSNDEMQNIINEHYYSRHGRR